MADIEHALNATLRSLNLSLMDRTYIGAQIDFIWAVVAHLTEP